MSTSSKSSVSSAEEVTENSKIDNRSHLNIDNPIFNSSFHPQIPQINGNDIKYDPIKPGNIHIINLNVDSQLQPSHFMINKKNNWKHKDSTFENQRLESIMKFLISNKDIDQQEPFQKRDGYLSLEDLKSFSTSKTRNRSKSLDNIVPFTDDPVAEIQNLTKSEKTHCDGLESSVMSQIMHSLDFQVTQRNERTHFILSELLIQTIEFLYSDELLQNCGINILRKPSPVILASFNENQSVMLGVMSFTSDSSISMSITPSCKAEAVAVIIVEEIKQICTDLKIREKFKKIFPPSLQILLQELECRRAFSSCEKRIRPQQTKEDLLNSSNNCQSESLSDATNELIKSAIKPLDIPVGDYPEINSNQCLPSYIITKIHPHTNNSVILRTQHNICPGCHIAFSNEKARRLRFCHYYGFNFCSVCHNNTLMLIPSRILANWDFTMLPVSCLARDLLKTIHSEPLFFIPHFSEKVRLTIRILPAVMRLRKQGQLMLIFIETCRQGHNLIKKSLQFPSHWLSYKCQMFSIADFQFMESGVMEEELRSFVRKCVEHISICPLCQAHGYLCEYCDNKANVIFPFEIDKVYQCAQCFGCSHIGCHNRFKDQPCPRCERRKIREQLKEKTLLTEDLE